MRDFIKQTLWGTCLKNIKSRLRLNSFRHILQNLTPLRPAGKWPKMLWPSHSILRVLTQCRMVWRGFGKNIFLCGILCIIYVVNYTLINFIKALFDENNSMYAQKPEEKWGKWLGFVFSYSIFTVALFLILTLLKKLPLTWSMINIIGITVIITTGGVIIKRLLKWNYSFMDS